MTDIKQKNKIKILFITHTSFMAGANRSLLQLMIELKNNYNIEPYVLIPKDKSNSTFIDILAKNNIQYLVARFSWFKSSKKAIKNYLYYILNIFFYIKIAYKLKNITPDLIHSNSSTIDIGVFLSKLKKTKHIWHLREFGYSDYNLTPYFGKKYEKYIYNMPNNIFIAISKKIQSEYKRIITKREIYLIYNGLPLCNKLASHINSTIQFCCIGLINESKNQIEIIKAAKILVNRYQCKNFHITFAGIEDFSYKKLLTEYIEKNKLSNYVTFLGEIDNVSDLLINMDVGLMVSTNEAFGRVTIEYMLHNLAVIASNSGANPELIDDKINGLLYELHNIDNLSELMYSLIQKPHTIKTLSNKALISARNKFSSSSNTKSIYTLYKEIL